ncbi:MAG: rod shape-determining protein MreC [Candidatus Moranbacteria bacterium]|nr:rod shape-determining protein MreC [Candidatus Moranbacteria bacterium]
MSRKFTSRKIFKVVIVCIITFLVMWWNPYNFFSGLRSFFIGITLPVQKTFASTADKVDSFGEAISSIGKLKKENRNLIEENLRLKVENVKMADIEKENIDLRNQLNILPRDKFNLESAHIIGRDSYDNNSWVLIDKGQRHGVEKGMSVIVSEGVLIGKIQEVFTSSAKVIFITDKSMNINVEAVETGAIGVVKGAYGLGLTMDLVLQTDSLRVGDKVITSDISQNIPRGLLVGEIKEVDPAKNDLFQKAIISPPIDFSKLRFVFVIKNVNN